MAITMGRLVGLGLLIIWATLALLILGAILLRTIK